MSNNSKIKRIPKAEVRQKPTHPVYRTFNDVKSAAITLARLIAADCKDETPSDVQRFIDEFGLKS